MKRVSEKIYNLINEQIQKEEDSSRLYLAISNYLNYSGWSGASKLFKKYSDEELKHRDKFIEYLLDRDALPKTSTLKEYPLEFGNIESIVNKGFEHEIFITESIKNIQVIACKEEDDRVTVEFLNWYMAEQKEEEAKMLYWQDRIKMMKETNTPLFFLDKEMGEN